jgi:hypothetical protein
LVSLDFKSEENLKNYKKYISKLNDYVDGNIKKHKQFMDLYNKKTDSNDIDPTYSQNSPYKNISANVSKILSPEISEKYNPNFVHSQRTDVTNIDHFSRRQNINYYDYVNAKKKYLNYNKEVIETKEKQKITGFENKKKNGEELTNDLEKNIKYEEALRNYHLEQQRSYQNILENQIQEKENMHKRGRSFNGLQENIGNYAHYNNITSNKMNNNSFSMMVRDPSLGESFIEHNTILNPVPNFKHNKYLYRDISSLKLAGNSIIY